MKYLLVILLPLIASCQELKCGDDHESCATWAASGECDKNPAFMHVGCKQSCAVCDPYDVSWATRSNKLTYNQPVYDDYMKNCKLAAISPKVCTSSEDERMKRNHIQPKGMLNFTETGFKVVRTPPELFAKIQAYWEKYREYEETEWESVVHSYQNSWDAASTMIPIQKYDEPLKVEIFDTTEDILQEWTGQRLAPSAFWGIRVYHNKSILAPHVDIPARILSVIINVDQDVEEDWPLEMWGHDGKAYNITLKPGDMALYESHSVIHGRPFPFKGNFFANIFVHFEPLGPASKPLEDYLTEPIGDFPPYLNPDATETMDLWKLHNPRGWNLFFTDIMTAVRDGHYRVVEDLVVQKPAMFHMKDSTGQSPMDLAIQSGQHEIVSLLMKMKCFDGDKKDVLVEKAKTIHGEDSDMHKRLRDEL